MPSSSDLELRRQLEEPLGGECRNYPTVSDRVVVTMIDTPYYPPFVTDAPHYHNYLEIGLCVDGNVSVLLNGKRYPSSAGAIIVSPKGIHHNQEYSDEQMVYWRYLVINEDYLVHVVPERFRQPIASFIESISGTGLFLSSDATGAAALIQMMFDLRRQDGDVSGTELELCTMLLMMLFARHGENAALSTGGEPVEAQYRQPIEPALAYVYEHYKEDIQISALAKSCSMSESYFRKQFLRIMNQSPLEYVNAYRIHRSMNLLRTTSDSIQNIAARSGFSSIAAFNRNFRRYAGVSASQWRRAKKQP